jgi:hypothetical protein
VIALIEVDQAVSGDAALAALPVTRRVGSKLFMVEGLSQETGLWDSLTPSRRYTAFQAGVQLANRMGALKFGYKDKPRLVHRLDKDTSGVLLLARTDRVARALSEALRHREARKIYWAVVAGVPHPRQGSIKFGLVKAPGRGRGWAVADGTGATAHSPIRARAAVARTHALKQRRRRRWRSSSVA